MEHRLRDLFRLTNLVMSCSFRAPFFFGEDKYKDFVTISQMAAVITKTNIFDDNFENSIENGEYLEYISGLFWCARL